MSKVWKYSKFCAVVENSAMRTFQWPEKNNVRSLEQNSSGKNTYGLYRTP